MCVRCPCKHQIDPTCIKIVCSTQPISLPPHLPCPLHPGSHPPATRPQTAGHWPFPPMPTWPSSANPRACKRPTARVRAAAMRGSEGECPKANLEELSPIDLTEDPWDQNRKYQWLNKQAKSSPESLKTSKRPSAKSSRPSLMPSMNPLLATRSSSARFNDIIILLFCTNN